jgi:hypothetical protein
MALSEATWLQVQHLSSGDLEYDISVNDRGDGVYIASWNCLKCGEKGALTPSGSTPDEALRLARICVDVHHQLIHVEPNRPKPR